MPSPPHRREPLTTRSQLTSTPAALAAILAAMRRAWSLAEDNLLREVVAAGGASVRWSQIAT